MPEWAIALYEWCISKEKKKSYFLNDFAAHPHAVAQQTIMVLERKVLPYRL